MNEFLNAFKTLIVDLFGIWSYPTFSVIIVIVCCYACVKLVQGMTWR